MSREGTASTVAMSPVEGPVAVVQPGVMEQQHQQQGGGQVGNQQIMKKKNIMGNLSFEGLPLCPD